MDQWKVLFHETWKGCVELFSPSGVFLKPYPALHELFGHENPPLVGSAMRVTVWFPWLTRPHWSNGVLTLFNKLTIISMLLVSPYKKHGDDSVCKWCIWENMYLCNLLSAMVPEIRRLWISPSSYITLTRAKYYTRGFISNKVTSGPIFNELYYFPKNILISRAQMHYDCEMCEVNVES